MGEKLRITTSLLIDDRPGNASLPAHHATMETEFVAPGEQTLYVRAVTSLQLEQGNP